MRILIALIGALLALLPSSQLICEPEQVRERPQPTEPYKSVFRLYKSTLPDIKQKDYPAWSWLEYIQATIAWRENMEPLHRFFRTCDAFASSTAFQSIHTAPSHVHTTSHFFKDIELFRSFSSDPQKAPCLFSQICRTQSMYGKTALLTLLSRATTDVSLLKKRQDAIRVLTNFPAFTRSLSSSLQAIHDCESLTLEFYDSPSFEQPIKREHLFTKPFLKRFNSSPVALSISDIWERGVRLAGDSWGLWLWYSLIAYGAYNLYKGSTEGASFLPEEAAQRVEHRAAFLPHPLDYAWEKTNEPRLKGYFALATAFFWYYSYKRSGENYYAAHLMDMALIQTMQQISTVFCHAEMLYDMVVESKELYTLPDFAPLITFFEVSVKKEPHLKELRSLLHTISNYHSKTSLYLHRGMLYRTYMLLAQQMHLLSDMFVGIGMIDAFVSTARLMDEKKKTDNPYCFARYLSDQEQPEISLSSLWNPLVTSKEIVSNELFLGGTRPHQHIIITGPNTGGKSTLQKAGIFAVHLAQTLGIAPAASCSITPFHYIDSCINVSDNTASGDSLFKEEVKRTHTIIETITNLAPGQKACVVFDEMFRGTTPLEGVSCAYATAYQLGQQKHALSLIATHFVELTKLAEENPVFKNMKVSVKRLADGTIKRIYKLEPGVTQQHIALDVLEESGVAPPTVACARDVLARLSPQQKDGK